MQKQKLAWFLLCVHKEIYAKSTFKILPWSDLEIELSKVNEFSYNHGKQIC